MIKIEVARQNYNELLLAIHTQWGKKQDAGLWIVLGFIYNVYGRKYDPS